MLDDAHAWALDSLSPYEREFYRLEVEERPPDVYRDRLRRIGFEGMGNVLDVACGLGQWTLALAELNGRAQGIDISVDRLLMANLLAQSRGATNVAFRWARMESLPFDDNSFDGAFCYGAFMFGDGTATCRELKRVLKAGARLYVNANGAGLYLRRLSRSRPLSRDTARSMIGFAQMTANRIAGRYKNSLYSRRRLARLFESQGFVVDEVADEGKSGSERVPAATFYPGRVHGLDGVFEVLAHKPG